MVKAIATSLVLIVGAAVILWYGNTLNSWVVGGLAGGFAALLLSIPISLVLFSYFSHHSHKARQGEVSEDEMVLVQQGSYSLIQDQLDNDEEEQELYYEDDEEEMYDIELDGGDEYILAEQGVWEEGRPRRVPSAHYLPSPSSAHDPAVSWDLSSQVYRDHYGADPERRSLQREKSASRPVENTGHERRIDPSYKRYRSQALHAARMEAVLRAEYDEENRFSSARSTKRLEQMQRSSQIFPLQDKSDKSRSPQNLPLSSMNGDRRGPRRIVDALPPRDRLRRRLPIPDDTELD